MGKQKEKQNLRKKIRSRIENISPVEWKKRSRKILKRLLRDPQIQSAKTLFCYVSKKNEVDTHSLLKWALKKNKRVFVPEISSRSGRIVAKRIRAFPKGMKPGKYGILEPAGKGERLFSLNPVDLFLVPGLGFDRHGGRLGKGKGMFDRFLAKLPDPSRCYGLALECQIVPRLPSEPHDKVVGKIFTEKKTIQVAR